MIPKCCCFFVCVCVDSNTLSLKLNILIWQKFWNNRKIKITKLLTTLILLTLLSIYLVHIYLSIYPVIFCNSCSIVFFSFFKVIQLNKHAMWPKTAARDLKSAIIFVFLVWSGLWDKQYQRDQIHLRPLFPTIGSHCAAKLPEKI